MPTPFPSRQAAPSSWSDRRETQAHHPEPGMALHAL